MTNLVVAMLTALVTAIVTWFGTNYFGRSLLRFWDLRVEAHKAILVSDKALLTNVGIDIDSLRVVMPKLILWYLRKRGYDPHSAAKGLIELSNRLGAGDVSEGYDAACLRVHVQNALHLPIETHDRDLAESRLRLENSGIWPPLIQ